MSPLLLLFVLVFVLTSTTATAGFYCVYAVSVPWFVQMAGYFIICSSFLFREVLAGMKGWWSLGPLPTLIQIDDRHELYTWEEVHVLTTTTLFLVYAYRPTAISLGKPLLDNYINQRLANGPTNHSLFHGKADWVTGCTHRSWALYLSVR